MKLFGVILGIAFCVSEALADDVVMDNGTGGINWTKGYIFATGFGVAGDDTPERKKSLLAKRAAKIDAYRNLAEIMSGIRVTSETTVKDMETVNDVVRTKLDAVVRGAETISSQYQNEVASVTLQVKMDGQFFNTIKKPELHGKTPSAWVPNFELFTPKFEFSWLSNLPLFNTANAEETSNQSRIISSTQDLEFAKKIKEQLTILGSDKLLKKLEKEIAILESSFGFTGLLIDASEVSQFELATIPKIRNSKGDIIYPSDELLAGEALLRTPVSYDFDIDDAINNDRVAINPFIIKAKSIFHARRSDLVIDDEDANSILANNVLTGVIQEAGVMIVVKD